MLLKVWDADKLVSKRWKIKTMQNMWHVIRTLCMKGDPPSYADQLLKLVGKGTTSQVGVEFNMGSGVMDDIPSVKTV